MAGGGGRGISQGANSEGYTVGIFDVPGMFVQQAIQGNAAFDLAKFTWLCWAKASGS
jgi:hypothetical protein